jgi:hypothetical protein
VRVTVLSSGTWEALPNGASDRIFEKMVPTGATYDVQVVSSGHMTIERSIAVNRALAATRVYLVPDGWSFYLAGGIEVPFEPRPRLAGVVIPRSLTAAEITRLNAIALHEGFTPLAADPVTRQKFDDVKRSVLYFEPTDPSVVFFSFAAAPDTSHDRVPPDAVNKLARIFAAVSGRVGSPVSVKPGRVRILDNRYHLRFSAAVTDDEVQRFAESLRATVVRQIKPNLGFWLIEFSDPQNPGRHLDQVVRHVRRGTLSSGEPNLHFQLQAHAAKVVSRSIVRYFQGLYCEISNIAQLMNPKDPYERCQKYLSRQKVRQAWCYLDSRVPSGRYGLPSVHVATIDKGIVFRSSDGTSTHQELDTSRLKYCYNVESSQACGEDEDGPDLHGMASYGIIAGVPDNNFGITGIAPNTSHVAIDGSSTIQQGERYAGMLKWVGGIQCSPPDDYDGLVPPIPSADIISCSHGIEGHPDLTIIKGALQELARAGRNGLGTVIVFSAGNEDCYIPDEHSLATDPHTIGVANTEVVGNVESRWHKAGDASNAARGSNCGPLLDLCANGEGAPSLSMDDETALSSTPACRDSEDSRKGIYIHGGTSAAAAMVAGAAALVLTINSKLSWRQVRDVLRASAEKIDCDASHYGVGQCDLPMDGTWRQLDPPSGQQQEAVPCEGMDSGLNWFSDFYGYGRLNVYAAVKLAATVEPESLPNIPLPCTAS